MTRTLHVWWNEKLVGSLTQNQHGELGFAYDAAWLGDADAPALSISLPKRNETFTRRECRPFFGGLLPEEDQRDAAAKAVGVSRANDFALLDKLGGDVAGALELLPPGEFPRPPIAGQHPAPLDDANLIAVLDTLPARPMLAGDNGLRLSLAGAQSKLPVVLVDGAIALPLPGQPTTHILKPPIARFKATTENEALAMRLAAAVGLHVAAVEPRVVAGRPFLLIARYDRQQAENDIIARIHQEDFCQALGVPSETKYASEGGPAFKDCFKLLRDVSTRPATEIGKLLDAAIFNAIVGNADAHGKNFSLLYRDRAIALTPLYDLLSTVVYSELSQKFAMKIGKRATLDELDNKGWTAFASDAGVGLPLVRRRIGELTAAVQDKVEAVAANLKQPGLDEAAIDGLADMISVRAKSCAATI